MLFTSIITGLAVAATPALAIPPPIFGFPDSDNHTELTVAYAFNGNTSIVQEGSLFGGNITQQQPQLSLDAALYQSVADYNGQYTLIMVDPDASTPEDPSRRFILHWLSPNLTQTTDATTRALTPPTTAFVPYNPPTPPTTSSAHRYILYAFQQPADFAIPAQFAALEGGQNRANFNLTQFIAAAGLGRPAAAEYFYVNRQTQVPGTFVAAPGGTYPGGNGGMVTEASVAANGTATATGSGSATATGGAAGTGTTTAGAIGGWRGWSMCEGVLGIVGLGVAALL